MESLNRTQLSAMCKLLEMTVFGNDQILRWRLSTRLQTLKADDIVIDSEGIETMSQPELEEVATFLYFFFACLPVFALKAARPYALRS
jgi:hypothetical protein